MSTPNPKLIDLDFAQGGVDARTGASPIIPMPGHNPSNEGGPAAEMRDLMDQLQQTAWEARARLRAVEDERDSVAARFQEVQRGNDELRARLSESSILIQERETLQKEVQRYTRAAQEREGRAIQAEKQTMELQRRCDDLTRQRDELNRSLQAHAQSAQRGADSPTQLANLRQARDAAQATVRELTLKLEKADDEVADLRDQVESFQRTPGSGGGAELAHVQAELRTLQEQYRVSEAALAEACRSHPAEDDAARQRREETQLQLEIVSKEVFGLRTQLAEKTSEAESLMSQLAESRQQRIALEASIEPLRQEQAATRQSYEEALTSLAAAQKQIERIGKERDDVREEATRQALVLEGALEQQRVKLEQLEQRTTTQEMALQEAEHAQEALAQLEADKAELAERYEAQRLQTIDLGARLEAEQYQIKVMSARLAEARLLGRSSTPRPEEAAAPLVEAAPAPVVAQTAPGFDTAVALEAIRAMRRCYHAFAKAPEDSSHLNELHTHIHSLAEHAQETEFIALHRLVSAFDAFIQELYHFPEQINPTSLHTIPQTIEFLAALMKLKEPQILRDAATATVYVVEDDPLTCECLTMAMETSMMRGICSQDPAKAAYELAGTPCDLILLDINMPGMDGFELCAGIRNLTLHRDTPIMFLSGMDSLEMRERAAMVGGCDFLPKPFILCELTLKALLHIAKAQLRMA